MLGTTDYVSPEQALGQHVNGQSDLYSLGIVLYEMLTGEVPFKGENQVAVAMKHVREEVPDVQVKRPEVSAALAAVVETATAKRQEDRYANDAELIADLEDVLAIETARAGSATGEVDDRAAHAAVARRSAGSRSACATRRRSCPGAGRLLVAAIAAALVFLVPRTHHGTGELPQPRPPKTHAQVQLCTSCAHDYNPDAVSGPKNQHPGEDGLAIDGNRNTAWTTETYYYGLQSKPGVGLYVDANPGVVARSMIIDTATPGYTVAIYARHSSPDPDTFDVGPNGWVKVGSASYVHSTADDQAQHQGRQLPLLPRLDHRPRPPHQRRFERGRALHVGLRSELWCYAPLLSMGADHAALPGEREPDGLVSRRQIVDPPGVREHLHDRQPPTGGIGRAGRLHRRDAHRRDRSPRSGPSPAAG